MSSWIRLLVPAMVIACIPVFAQTGIRGLTPGKSSKAEVERALGAPQRQISDAFSEYAGKTGERILVQYREGSGVERIDVIYKEAAERAAVLTSLGLASTADARSTTASGRLEEFFKAGQVTVQYRSNQAAGVMRVTRSTPEAFATALAVAPAFSGMGVDAPPPVSAAPKVSSAPVPVAAPKPVAPVSPPAANSPFAALRGKYAFRRSTEPEDQVQIEIVDGAVEWKTAKATYRLRQTGSGSAGEAQLLQFEPVGVKTIKITVQVLAGKVTEIQYADFGGTKMFSGLAFPVQ